MRSGRLWIELLSLCVGAAFGLAVALAALGVIGLAFGDMDSAEAADVPGGQIYEGMVTDARCGAKHSAKIGASAADCTRTCVHGGDAFALVAGEKTYLLEGNAASLKSVAGDRATIVGTRRGNTIAVASVNGR
jgi:hypothetical protein